MVYINLLKSTWRRISKGLVHPLATAILQYMLFSDFGEVINGMLIGALGDAHHICWIKKFGFAKVFST